jgi:hypothetical protein
MRSKQDVIRLAEQRKRLRRTLEKADNFRFIGMTPKRVEDYMRRLPESRREMGR